MKGQSAMPVDKAFVDHVMELLDPLEGVAGRAMFGGYGIFHNGDMFALISGSTLYFKVNEENIEQYEKAGLSKFTPMPYYEVPEEVMENEETFLEWAEISIDIGHRTAKKKKR